MIFLILLFSLLGIVFVIQGSLEDLFEREEIKFHSSDDILNYLSDNGKRDKNSYRSTAAILGEPLAIRQDIEKAKDFDELRNLKKDAQRLDAGLGRDTLVEDVEIKMKEISEELIAISEERKEERLEEERIEKIRVKAEKKLEKIDISGAETLGEINKLENRLDKLEDEGADIEDTMALLGERLRELEEEKEEKTRIIQEQQEEAKLKKEKLRESGIEPSF